MLTRTLCIVAALCFSTTARAQLPDWSQWRGPNFDGSTVGYNLPVTWSQTHNVRWSAPMPGLGGGTPVVWKEIVFVNSVDKASGKNVCLAYELKTGKPLWKHELGTAVPVRRLGDESGCSPVVNDEVVVFMFSSGDMGCFEHDGRLVWKRNIPKKHGAFGIRWGYNASPLLLDQTLYLSVLDEGKGDSYLLGIDLLNGTDVFRVTRNIAAREESRDSYATPIPRKAKDGYEVVLIGADHLTGHDPVTGKEKWRWGTYNPNNQRHYRMVPTPTEHNGLIYFSTPQKFKKFYAVRAPESGTVGADHVAWTSDQVTTDVCCPLVYDGLLYVLDGDARQLACFDPATGELHYKQPLPRGPRMRGSPVAADGKIYFIDMESNAFVVKAGKQFELLGQNALGDQNRTRSTIVIAGDALLIRTGARLFCIGKAPG